MEKGVRARNVEGILSDEDILKELARLRDRNLSAQLESKKVADRTRKENSLCRKRYEKHHKERMRKEYLNSLAHLKVFGNMYDNSPFRYDLVKQTSFREEKRRTQEKQEEIYQATYKKLQEMTGVAEDFIVNWAEDDILNKCMTNPMRKEVLKHKQTLLNVDVLSEELNELKKMVDNEKDIVMDKFPIIEKTIGKQIRTYNSPKKASSIEYATSYLAGIPVDEVTGTGTGGSSRPGTGTGTGSHHNTADDHTLRAQDIVLHHHGAPIPVHHQIHNKVDHSSSFDHTPHKKVYAGSAKILMTGHDGNIHTNSMNIEELEGKVDHHNHKPGDALWDPNALQDPQKYSHHQTLNSHSIGASFLR